MTIYKIPEEVIELLEKARLYRCEQDMIALLKKGTTIDDLKAVLLAEDERMRLYYEGRNEYKNG
tara:strand:- start:1202 stop:1393 length:192 start_codon:yes stop_codon:yes gene_type:complete